MNYSYLNFKHAVEHGPLRLYIETRFTAQKLQGLFKFLTKQKSLAAKD